MKRIISFFLLTVIIVQSFTLSFAANNDMEISYDGYSKYKDFETIYYDGKDYYQQNNDRLVEVKKIVIPLSCINLKSELESYKLNSETIDDIVKKAMHCSKEQQSKAEVVFFVNTENMSPARTTTQWGGKTFHHEEISIINYWSEYKTIFGGSATTYNFLNNLSSFTISVLGTFSTPISVFGVGISALQFFGSTPEYCNANNYVQSAVKADWYTKYTYYYYFGVDQLGCISHHIDFKQLDTVEFFISYGVGVRKNRITNINESSNSYNYSNPEAMAYSVVYNGLAPVFDYIDFKVDAGAYQGIFRFQ